MQAIPPRCIPTGSGWFGIYYHPARRRGAGLASTIIPPSGAGLVWHLLSPDGSSWVRPAPGIYYHPALIVGPIRSWHLLSPLLHPVLSHWHLLSPPDGCRAPTIIHRHFLSPELASAIANRVIHRHFHSHTSKILKTLSNRWVIENAKLPVPHAPTYAAGQFVTGERRWRRYTIWSDTSG